MPIKYPFKDMKVGDSFFLEGNKADVVSGSIVYWNKKLAPAKFVSRLFDEKGERFMKGGKYGFRVFRVK